MDQGPRQGRGSGAHGNFRARPLHRARLRPARRLPAMERPHPCDRAAGAQEAGQDGSRGARVVAVAGVREGFEATAVEVVNGPELAWDEVVVKVGRVGSGRLHHNN